MLKNALKSNRPDWAQKRADTKVRPYRSLVRSFSLQAATLPAHCSLLTPL
jgi:hypothetical protein